MIQIDQYMDKLIRLLEDTFGGRLEYVGLQGSYARDEANERSDVDILLILDTLSPEDLDAYRKLVDTLRGERGCDACGFICGREEMKRWNRLEVGPLLFETRDYYGHLADFIPAFSRDDIRQHAKLCAGNLYHELCHRRVFGDEKNTRAAMPACFKQAFYILQCRHYLMSDTFVNSRRALLPLLTGLSREVLSRSIVLRDGAETDLDKDYRLLFAWCREMLENL